MTPGKNTKGPLGIKKVTSFGPPSDKKKKQDTPSKGLSIPLGIKGPVKRKISSDTLTPKVNTMHGKIDSITGGKIKRKKTEFPLCFN